MNFIKAILFGIIEGITEWMPVSSTAHMKILNTLLPLEVSAEFYEVFEVVIQLGAILALLLIFFNKVWPFGKSKNPLGNGILSIVKKDKFFTFGEGANTKAIRRNLLIGGICETVGQMFYMAVMFSDFKAGMPMISAYCAASVLWSRIFLKEKLSWKHYLAIALTFIGIVLLGIFSDI